MTQARVKQEGERITECIFKREEKRERERRDMQSSAHKRIRSTKALQIQEVEAEHPVQSIC